MHALYARNCSKSFTELAKKFFWIFPQDLLTLRKTTNELLGQSNIWINSFNPHHNPIRWTIVLHSVQFSSVAQSRLTLCDPMNCSTPGLPVHHQLPEFTQIHVHRVSDAIQPSHPLSSLSSPAPNPSQHQSLFQRVNSLHEMAKVLEFQL